MPRKKSIGGILNLPRRKTINPAIADEEAAIRRTRNNYQSIRIPYLTFAQKKNRIASP
ncbi:MAG: hypothetical protein OEY24_08370 [Candidatus Bathyarchaeota archaeon]|nr:hypothetical protein [Candidatus Bathyarchaeota archaeon]